jgi:hypothetical protein
VLADRQLVAEVIASVLGASKRDFLASRPCPRVKQPYRARSDVGLNLQLFSLQRLVDLGSDKTIQ